MIVVGDASFTEIQYVQSNPGNLLFLANAIDWLAQDEALINIRSKNRFSWLADSPPSSYRRISSPQARPAILLWPKSALHHEASSSLDHQASRITPADRDH